MSKVPPPVTLCLVSPLTGIDVSGGGAFDLKLRLAVSGWRSWRLCVLAMSTNKWRDAARMERRHYAAVYAVLRGWGRPYVEIVNA